MMVCTGRKAVFFQATVRNRGSVALHFHALVRTKLDALQLVKAATFYRS